MGTVTFLLNAGLAESGPAQQEWARRHLLFWELALSTGRTGHQRVASTLHRYTGGWAVPPASLLDLLGMWT